MASHHVLLLGGGGRISKLLTPLLLSKSWTVTSVVRNPDHKSELLALGEGKPGKIDVLVESLEDMKGVADAKAVLDRVKPSIVVWSAGAGGKGDPSRTFKVDRDAAKYWISASLADKSVKKFMMVSYIASRKSRAPWWTDEDWAGAQKTNTETLPRYAEAKIDADEHLLATWKKRTDSGDREFQCLNLRPGSLTNEPTKGVKLGKTSARGPISREAVAQIAAALLSRDDINGWIDALDGDDSVDQAVAKLVKEGHDGTEGEDLERIHARSTDI